MNITWYKELYTTGVKCNQNKYKIGTTIIDIINSSTGLSKDELLKIKNSLK